MVAHAQLDKPGKHATQMADKRWRIHDVIGLFEHSLPITNPDGSPVLDDDGQPVEIPVGPDWLGAALKRGRDRHEGFGGTQDPYYPPLHIEHTRDAAGNPQRTEAAGHFEVMDVREAFYEGEKLAGLVVDLIVPDEVYQEIRDGRLTYLSPEIHDLRNPEVDSIALMDDTVPYFRQQLRIASETPFQGAATAPRPIAFAARGGRAGSPILMYQATAERGRTLLSAMYCCPECTESTMDGENDEKLSPAMADKLMSAFGSALSAMTAAPADAEPTGDTEDPGAMLDDTTPAPAELPPSDAPDELLEDDPEEDAKAMNYQSKLAKVEARYEARIAALETRINAGEQRDARVTRAAEAIAKLEAAGFTSEAVRKRVMHYAAKPAELEVFVTTMLEQPVVTPGPGDSSETIGLQRTHAPSGPWPKDLQYMAQRPAQQQAEARELMAEYDRWDRAGHKPSCEKHEYVAMNLGKR